VLVGGVVDHQVEDHLDAPVGGPVEQLGEVAEGTQARVDAVEVGDVVAVVAARRRVDRVQPHAGHAQPGQVVQPTDQALQVTHPVPVGVGERLDVEGVDDGFGVPARIHAYRGAHGTAGAKRAIAL
jgi:hypothetical protein